MELSARASDPVVDFHAHVTPVRFQEAIARSGEWHGLDATTGELEVEGFRRPLDVRLADMDADGIDMQAVSPNAGFYQYQREADRTARIARDCNDEIAEMCAAHPDRFVGLGTLPMQDTRLAVQELERIMLQLGFAGVMVGDHVNGRTWDEPEFAPFWKAAEELGALVFFHQGSGTVVSHRISRYHLDNSVGNLTDRALTFGALVGGGVIDRHPNLKLLLGHAGGYVAFGSARMDRAWQAGRELTEEGVDPAIALGGARSRDERGTARPPSSYLRAFYYDCCTYTPGTLRFLVDTVGADRVVMGSDYPAPMMIRDPVRWVRGVNVLSDEEQRAILSTNAHALLTRSSA